MQSNEKVISACAANAAAERSAPTMIRAQCFMKPPAFYCSHTLRRRLPKVHTAAALLATKAQLVLCRQPTPLSVFFTVDFCTAAYSALMFASFTTRPHFA